ncbi:unnamed protein product [Choristocarpus tenellus]
MMFMYNVLRLITGGSSYIPREEYVSRLLANVWILAVCFSFAKARWVGDNA